MAKRLTNIQAVTRMMDYSAFGPLAQMFIMDAIQKQADKIAAFTLPELTALMGADGMVSPAAWHGVAKEVQQKLAEHFAS